MLKHIDIKGYRSLKDVSLDMEPLTVLIGPNACGKSNFMDVFALLNEGTQNSLAEAFARRGGIRNLVFTASRHGIPDLVFDLHVMPIPNSEMEMRYHFSLIDFGAVWDESLWIGTAGKGRPLIEREKCEISFKYRDAQTSKYSRIEAESKHELGIRRAIATFASEPFLMLDWMQTSRVYRSPQVGPESEIRRPQIIRPGVRVFTSCANTVAVLHSIREKHPAVWEEIIDVLKVAHPELHHITFPPEGGDGRIILRWFEKPFDEAGFSPEHLSDGIMRMLALVAILMTPDPPPLICIDEPEIGLHPELIELVAELLQSAATRTQLIVATHSPELVSKLKPERGGRGREGGRRYGHGAAI